MQFQADITGAAVRRPRIRETTALGAAMLAGLAAGLWKDENEAACHWTLDKEYTRKMPPEEAVKRLVGWDKAVGRAKGWAEEDA